jgi:site-specific DNA-cytosine methylase
MQIISLFSGIGGFEYAAEQIGWKNILSCEINPFGRKVLEYYWPKAYHHDDIKTLDIETITKKSKWNPLESTIVVGGFP